jgi:hypothetical protein
MWLLPYLEKMNAKDMKSKGLKLKVKDIYNTEGTSLKDAIVIFGNGCTGEIVSGSGLLLTNHHCGYPNIQSVSTVERKPTSPDIFSSAPPMDSTCGCNDCSYMKLVTLEKIAAALEIETPEVTVPENIRSAAEKSIRAMLSIK